MNNVHKANVCEDDTVFGVINDVVEFLVEQTRVECVADGPSSGNSIPNFKVAVGVPGECGDAVSRADAQAAKGEGAEGRSISSLFVGGCDGGAFYSFADDLLIAMHFRSIIDNLHCTVHDKVRMIRCSNALRFVKSRCK